MDLPKVRWTLDEKPVNRVLFLSNLARILKSKTSTMTMSSIACSGLNHRYKHKPPFEYWDKQTSSGIGMFCMRYINMRNAITTDKMLLDSETIQTIKSEPNRQKISPRLPVAHHQNLCSQIIESRINFNGAPMTSRTKLGVRSLGECMAVARDGDQRRMGMLT